MLLPFWKKSSMIHIIPLNKDTESTRVQCSLLNCIAGIAVNREVLLKPTESNVFNGRWFTPTAFFKYSLQFGIRASRISS